MRARRPVGLMDANGLDAPNGLDANVQVRHVVTEADLNEALRQACIERIENARKLTLEPSGKISVLKKS